MQIQPQRLAQSVRMIPQRFPQPAQRIRPEPDVARTAFGEITTVLTKERFHIFRHILQFILLPAKLAFSAERSVAPEKPHRRKNAGLRVTSDI